MSIEFGENFPRVSKLILQFQSDDTSLWAMISDPQSHRVQLCHILHPLLSCSAQKFLSLLTLAGKAGSMGTKQLMSKGASMEEGNKREL